MPQDGGSLHIYKMHWFWNCFFKIFLLLFCAIMALSLLVMVIEFDYKNKIIIQLFPIFTVMFMVYIFLLGLNRVNKKSNDLIFLNDFQIEIRNNERSLILRKSEIFFIEKYGYRFPHGYVIVPKERDSQKIYLPAGLKTDDYFSNWISSLPPRPGFV
jgi:hypothetical protein